MAEVNPIPANLPYADSAAVAWGLFCGQESSKDQFGEPFRLGLRPLSHDQVLIKDSNYERDLAEKQALFARDPNAVWQQLPNSDAAQKEAAAYLLAGGVPTATKQDDDSEALRWAGSVTQEDLVIMMPSPKGHVLVAGYVCFPSAWRLLEKIGKPMAQVHTPVPGFQAGTRNAEMIERLFTHLKPSQPLQRMNWSLVTTDALHTPYAHERVIDYDGEWQDLTLRVERQTLHKLPNTKAVLFTIRIFVEPLLALRHHADPGHWRGFLRQLHAMTQDQRGYKGIHLDG